MAPRNTRFARTVLALALLIAANAPAEASSTATSGVRAALQLIAKEHGPSSKPIKDGGN